MALYHNYSKLGRVKLPNNTIYALIDVDGRAMLAPDFSAEASYTAGDHVIYNDDLYRFDSAHAAGAWVGTDATLVTVDSEIQRLEGLIAGGIHYRGKTSTILYDGATTGTITINGASYTAQAGDLVIEDLNAVKVNYATGTAYSIHTYLKNDGIYYITNAAITATENTSITAIASKIDVIKQDPMFLFDGSAWNVIASADGFGDLAFKDSASGSYVKPTGSGTATVTKALGTVTKQKLSTTTITGTNGTEKVSKMTAGTAKDVAKAGTAVRYGTANVGTAVTYGTANRASSATTVGNANVGEAVVYGTADVGAAVSVATAGTQVVYGTADVGTAVTYGTANPGTAVTGIAKVDSQKTFTTNGIVTSVDGDCLQFSNASTGTVYGVKDATGVSITPAVASNTTLTPAKAADTSRKLTPVGGTTNITPAVSADSTRKLTPAVASTTTIYGAVNSSTTLTPAVAAPNDQTIVPAVANGTITPWTESEKTVAKVAASATTVATGSLEEGTQIVTGVSATTESASVSVGTTSATVTVK